MIVWKKVGIFAVSLVSMASVACSGSDGATGPAGAAGPAGDKGDTGPAGTGTTPSLGVIVPNIGLLDREVDVTVTAEAVDFTAAAPTFDFGSGVKASNIQVLSATTAYVHLAVDAGATTGARDVKVTSGANNLTSKGGFKVAAPISVTVTPNPAQQGGFALLDVTNLDTQHAFDTAGNFFVSSSEGIPLALTTPTTTATQSTGNLVLLDPSAATDSQVAAANFDANGNPVVSYAGDSFKISARTPTALTVGTALTGQNLATPGATSLYKYSTSTAAITEVVFTPTGDTLEPALAVYGSSGKSADALVLTGSQTPGTVVSYAYPTAAAASSNFITIFDIGVGGGAAAQYGYGLNVVTHTGTVYAEPAGAHDTIAHATTNNVKVTALPLATTNNGDILTGSLAAKTEEDWIGVDLADGDALEITLIGGDGTLLDLTDSTGTSYLFDPDPFFGFDARPLVAATSKGPSTTVASDAAGDPIAAGTYYLHIMGGTGAYSVSLRKR